MRAHADNSALRASSKMPREPRCVRNRVDARKGDEDVQKEGTSRSPDAAGADSCRNPKGRAVLLKALGRTKLS